MSFEECLQVLGLEKGYTGEQLKTAYRNSALIWHPDRFQTSNEELRKRAEKEMQRVNEAFQALKTNTYSYTTASQKPTAPPPPYSSAPPPRPSPPPPPRQSPPPRQEYSPPRPTASEIAQLKASKLKEAMKKPTRNFKLLGLFGFLILLVDPHKDPNTTSPIAFVVVWTVIIYWIWWARKKKKIKATIAAE